MGYLFFGFSITWALIAAYVVILGRRQNQLKKEIRQLEDWNSER